MTGSGREHYTMRGHGSRSPDNRSRDPGLRGRRWVDRDRGLDQQRNGSRPWYSDHHSARSTDGGRSSGLPRNPSKPTDEKRNPPKKHKMSKSDVETDDQDPTTLEENEKTNKVIEDKNSEIIKLKSSLKEAKLNLEEKKQEISTIKKEKNKMQTEMNIINKKKEKEGTLVINRNLTSKNQQLKDEKSSLNETNKLLRDIL